MLKAYKKLTKDLEYKHALVYIPPAPALIQAAEYRCVFRVWRPDVPSMSGVPG